ncbi:arf-GAP domain and FG repeat-containing protein 1 isoform X3 [Salmo salar]|uniref:Arf-GAP domain and FG repeat-containing protein 1 isoform X3 n=1 Tax=Salmo salar TaxID=8030 RepID=A0A1S3LUY4_SALSA|nr:arf-GAP domain and FG repeat-containing protein 1-like isoform X3 [Salmo salar]|eukprot:XP_013994752.1 PREDICTED: arf-GAP domain and FG repeat-containing protein 1-like isoform X3 [Salmo salar]
MATSAKRKQEETHLKMLREMTSQPPNRKCFDCDQRGPTYANMTVGSFVCTTCSGILRGLNPPHRVKSISMTTFTQQEIEFLQKHTNEVCKHIWLGLYNDRTLVVPDFHEPQKVKEFLQEKYEKKRWYVSPDQARTVATAQASKSGTSASSTGSTPEVQPLKTLQLNKTPPTRQSPVVVRSQAYPIVQEKKFDLLSDLGGDIFAAPPSQAASNSNFANFAHFPSQSGRGVPVPSVAGAVPAPSQLGISAEDRYAALAELDNELSSSAPTGSSVQGNMFGAVLGTSPAQTQPVLPSMHVQQGFGAIPSNNPFVAAAPDMATNPFQTNGIAPAAASFGTGSMSMPAGFGNPSSYCLPTSFSGTFQQPFPGQAPCPYTQPGAYHPQQPNGPGGYPVYGQTKPSMTPFGQPMAGPGMTNNPFMAGAPAGSYPAGGSSTNPFL